MESLPVEVVEMISSHLTVQALAACCAVSHWWRDAFNQDRQWRHHCGRPLEEYLRTTPAIVEPFFVSPESEGSTLSPVCQWRLAFMRENHLWNNWRTGNYQTQVIKTNDSKYFNSNCYLQYGFLSNEYVVILFKFKIELWDVTKKEASKVSETLNPRNNLGSFLIVGNSNEMFVIVNEHSVEVYGIDATRQIVMKYVLFINLEEKISNKTIDLAKIRFEHEQLDLSKLLDYSIVGAIFLLIMERNLHIWDLETGQKLKNEPCPLDMSHVFVDCITSESSTDIVVVATSAEGFNILKHNHTFFYFVYSTTSLAFLPFTQKSEYSYRCTCIYDHFIGISDLGGIRVYNYRNSKLIFQMTGTGQEVLKLKVVNNNFVFNHDKKIKMFHTLNKTIKSFSDSEVFDFKIIGGRFLELETVNDFPCFNRVWELGDFLSVTAIASADIHEVNRNCTRLFYKKNEIINDKNNVDTFEIELQVQHFW